MRIVIDLQGAQSESRFRGIGRYALAISTSIAVHAKNHEIIIVLNGSFTHTIEPIKQAFAKLLPKDGVRIFYAPTPVFGWSDDNEWRIKAGEQIREAFFASLKPDVIFIPSLFEGYGDNSLTSIKAFDDSILTVVTLHDLIPLARAEHYLKDAQSKKWYFQKLDFFKKADFYLSDSEYSKFEANTLLNIPLEKISTIYPAIDESFYPTEVLDETRQAIINKYNLSPKFILYAPGGFDERKNLHNVLKAFAMTPKDIKTNIDLVIVGRGPKNLIDELKELSDKLGVKNGVKLIGYVEEEELKTFYRTCELFIFASLHEGFGMPPLEAMACGAPVIASNTTSIPEVIGFEEALFDPLEPKSISDKITLALSDEVFYNKLKEHGLRHRKTFSWDASAQKALKIFEQICQNKTQIISKDESKLKLAYFSPLPPTESGIADYSFQLLPQLAQFYDITVIVEYSNSEKAPKDIVVQNVAWFLENSSLFDRILYHIGNSHYHGYMFELLKEHQGAVMLHDFFLSNAYYFLEQAGQKDLFGGELYRSHGFNALLREKEFGIEFAKANYPMSLDILSNAMGVLSHSDYIITKAKEFFNIQNDFFYKVPFNKSLPILNKEEARARLGFMQNDFIVCSFGIINQTKQSLETLEAWLATQIAYNENAYFIFVGKLHNGDYGKALERRILESGLMRRIIITDYVDVQTYQDYLAAADVAVQLRTSSRGETSAAVYDAIAANLPLIINAHGTMAEISQDICIKLNDEFTLQDLQIAFTNVAVDEALRVKLAQNCKNFMANHTSKDTALAYKEAIENIYTTSLASLQDKTLKKIAKVQTNVKPTGQDLSQCAKSLVCSYPPIKYKQILVDVSGMVEQDLKTGIQRVVRAILLQSLNNQPKGYRVEPVYNCGGSYAYARNYTLGLIGISNQKLTDDMVNANAGDIFFGLDFFSSGTFESEELLIDWHTRGVKMSFVVYDLLPIIFPNFFMPKADEIHIRWINSIMKYADSFLCISQAVSDELKELISLNFSNNRRPAIGYFHLGADVHNSAHSVGLPANYEDVLINIKSKPSFLMVGTIEPRKGYAQTLKAFETLWKQNINCNLIIVGKRGWLMEKLIEKIIRHKELSKKLFWLESISDEYLEKIYASSSCLISASEGEGFGLPLIEAAQHKTPIIARDIPVFKEVAKEYAYYFKDDNNPKVISDAVLAWLELYEQNKYPKSDDMPWLTWKQSSDMAVYFLLQSTNAD